MGPSRSRRSTSATTSPSSSCSVSRHDAAAALDAEYPRELEAELCRKLAARLLRRYQGDRRAGERVARHLAGRGFPGRLAFDALPGATAAGDYDEME